MPNDTRLTFQIEGLSDDSGNVRLETFSEKLALFQRVLRISEEAVVGHRRATTVLYRVVDLRHDSPASVTVEGFPDKTSTVEHAHKVVSYLYKSLATIRTGRTEHIDGPLIEAIEGMAQGVGEKFSRILIKRGDSGVAIDDCMANAFSAVEAQETTSWGTIRGDVERYNTHGQAQWFYLYPKLGGSVKCDFSDELTNDAAASVEKSVSVTGFMRYRPGQCRIAVMSKSISPVVDEAVFAAGGDKEGIAGFAGDGFAVAEEMAVAGADDGHP